MGKKAKKDRERIKGKVGGENKKGRNRKEGVERKSKKGKGREGKEGENDLRPTCSRIQ